MPVDGSERSYSERVVIMAPTARDAEVTRRLLARVGVDGVIGSGWRHVEDLVQEGVGALMITDVSLADPGFGGLLLALERQPPWSDLPVLALCRHGRRPLAQHEAGLRNLTMLDRPTSTRTLLSAVMTALRGRRWQYQIRDQIESLQQADRALRLADQRKDEFLATLAHELRNPLAPIRTGLELLSQLPPDAARRQDVMTMMDRQLRQLLRLIDDLLEVSRISTGKLILQRERLDLRRVVETALEGCAPLVARGKHALTVSLPDTPVWVDGDAARLAQSLSNLVNNAAKYTLEGGRIAVNLASVGGEAVLSVQDNGVGLPADMIGRVFDMFAQINRSLERAQGGLGIGLALVRSLITLHGGQVSAASPGPGHGSTFTIRLPLLEPQAAPLSPAPEAAPQPMRPLRVLVVDDNKDAAESLALLLSLDGHEVRVEHSGQGALEAATAFQPQAVFCDLGMPGMDGHEFAAQLRRTPCFSATLLVALTGWGTEDDKRRSRESGFDAHLTKPASEGALAALLARLS